MFQTLYNETSDWIVYLAYMTSFEQIPGIVSRPGYEDRWPAGQVKNNNTALIICLGTVVAVIICIPGILCWKKNKKQNTKEEPEMEKNANYGVDDEYYDEHDSRVQDTNDILVFGDSNLRTLQLYQQLYNWATPL